MQEKQIILSKKQNFHLQNPELFKVQSQTLFKPKNQLFSDSLILCSKQDKFKAQCFFKERKRCFQSKLLYRASQNSFSVKQFHDKCDGIAHTIIFIKTKFNKIIGGYTPLTWKGSSVRNGSNQQDMSKQSFLFSVTNKDKLTITSKSKKQIQHNQNFGPIFNNGKGISDLYVCDAANNDSWAYIGNGYGNPKYKRTDMSSRKLFSGQSDGSAIFEISQWQLYELNF